MSVDLIMGLGDDQLNNQFVFLLPTGIPGGGDADAISLRMEETFPIPEEGVSEYIIEYQGLQIIKTTMKEDTDKHFEITVRVDSGWSIYNDLKDWKNMVFNPVTGTALPDSMTRTTAVVQALDGQKNVVKTFTFKHSKLQKIGISEFDHTGEEPIKLTLTFIFGYMEED